MSTAWNLSFYEILNYSKKWWNTPWAFLLKQYRQQKAFPREPQHLVVNTQPFKRFFRAAAFETKVYNTFPAAVFPHIRPSTTASKRSHRRKRVWLTDSADRSSSQRTPWRCRLGFVPIKGYSITKAKSATFFRQVEVSARYRVRPRRQTRKNRRLFLGQVCLKDRNE